MCLNIIKQIAYSSLLASQLWVSCSADSLQVGTMYAENIQGVGLYLGLESENLVAHASGYIDATLLISSAYDAQEPVFGGVSVGLRTAVDLPLSPYVGVGLYLGQNEKEIRANNDKLDNDGDGFIDEHNEIKVDNTVMSAVYPELGWRLAVGDNFSLRVMSRYMVSSFGRQHDDWFYGLSLAFSQ